MCAASWTDCGATSVRIDCLLAYWTPEHTVRVPNDCHDYNPHHERVSSLW
jgi:hypothetical protein